MDNTYANEPQLCDLRPGEGNASTLNTPTRTGKTRRGRRGGRGRSLSPYAGICGTTRPATAAAAAAAGALRKAAAGRWFATPDAVGHQPVQYHRALPVPSQHRKEVVEGRANVTAWGHQDLIADPLSVSWINTTRSFYHAKFAFGQNPSPAHPQQQGPRPPRPPMNGGNYRGAGETVGGFPLKPDYFPTLVERVQIHISDMASLFLLYRRRGASLSPIDMGKVEEQLRGVSAMLLQLCRELKEAHGINAKHTATAATAGMAAASRLPPTVDCPQGPFGGRTPDMTVRVGHIPQSGGRGVTSSAATGLPLGAVAVQGMGAVRRGDPTTDTVSDTNNIRGAPGLEIPMSGPFIPSENEISERPCQQQVQTHSLYAGGSASTLCSTSSASVDNDTELDGQIPRKKKRRGKRGIRKGKKQLEGFAGFPLAPGLGPEYAGQPRRRLPKAPPLRIMGGEHDLSEFCLQDDDEDDDAIINPGTQTGSGADFCTPNAVPVQRPTGVSSEHEGGRVPAATASSTILEGSYSERLGRYGSSHFGEEGGQRGGGARAEGAFGAEGKERMDQDARERFLNDVEDGAVAMETPREASTWKSHGSDRVDKESSWRPGNDGLTESRFLRFSCTKHDPSAASTEERRALGKYERGSEAPLVDRRLARPSPLSQSWGADEEGVGNTSGVVVGPDDETPRCSGMGHFKPIPWQSHPSDATLPPTPRLYARGTATTVGVTNGAHHAGSAPPGEAFDPWGAASHRAACAVSKRPTNHFASSGRGWEKLQESSGPANSSKPYSPTRYVKATVADVKEAFERADTRVALQKRSLHASVASNGSGRKPSNPPPPPAAGEFERRRCCGTIEEHDAEVDDLNTTLHKQLWVSADGDGVNGEAISSSSSSTPLSARAPAENEPAGKLVENSETEELQLQLPPRQRQNQSGCKEPPTDKAPRGPLPAEEPRAAPCAGRGGKDHTTFVQEAVKAMLKAPGEHSKKSATA